MRPTAPSAYLRNFFRLSGESAWLFTRGNHDFSLSVDERVRERLKRTGDAVKQCLNEVDPFSSRCKSCLLLLLVAAG